MLAGGDQKVDRGAVLLRDAQRVPRVGRQQQSITTAPQYVADERVHVAIVAEQQHGLRLMIGAGAIASALGVDRLRRRGHVHREPRPAPVVAERALDDDVAAVLLHGAVDHREAKAGAARALVSISTPVSVTDSST